MADEAPAEEAPPAAPEEATDEAAPEAAAESPAAEPESAAEAPAGEAETPQSDGGAEGAEAGPPDEVAPASASSTKIDDDGLIPIKAESKAFTAVSSASLSRVKSERSVDDTADDTADFGDVSYSVSSLSDRKGESSAKIDDQRRSRAKQALGSVIDIRRASVVGGETFDRKVPRFLNTYKLDADNPFKVEKVDQILEAVMTEALMDLTYDPDKCPKQAKWASMSIRAKVKALEFDRYKIICMVTIGEKHSQDVMVTCRFLWDSDRDRYSIFTLENTYVFGVAQCYGLYYE